MITPAPSIASPMQALDPVRPGDAAGRLLPAGGRIATPGQRDALHLLCRAIAETYAAARPALDSCFERHGG